MSVASLIASSGALLGLLIAIALMCTKGQRAYSNRLLASGILISTSYLLSLIPLHSPELASLSLLRLGGISVFLFGPALYLYVRTMSDAGFRLQPRHLIHALPYCLILLDGFHAFGPLVGDHETFLISRPKLVGVMYYLLLLAYLLASTLRLYRFNWLIENKYSSLEGVSLRWLRTLVMLCLLLALVGLFFAVSRWLFESVSWPQQVFSISIMVSVYYLIAFFAITQPEVFNAPLEEAPVVAAARYETSSLTTEQSLALWVQLEDAMAADNPYLENQLKISALAEKLDVPVSHLSQTINQQGDCSFFEYINRYRVEAACKVLASETTAPRTMLDLALESGFNSESAFYKQFKKHTGLTPKQFQAGKSIKI